MGQCEMNMKNRPCPVCLDRTDSILFSDANYEFQKLDSFGYSSRKTPEYMHFRLMKCRVCDVLYADPAPESGFLEKAYEEASFGNIMEADYASRTYGSYLAEITKNIPDLASALDIGTGEGSFLKRLMEAGFRDVQGVEPSKAPIISAEEHIRPLIRQGVFRVSDYERSSFSLITCFQTIEHVMEPLELAKSVRDLLKPGGGFFVVCHDRRSFPARILGKKSPIFDIEHVQLFSRQGITMLFEKAGFKVIWIRNVWNGYPLGYWIKLFPFPVSIKKMLLDVASKTGVSRIMIRIPPGNQAVFGVKQ